MHPVVARLSERHHGVVTRQQLLAAGLSKDAIRHLRVSGEWERVGAGVYIRRGVPPTPEQRMVRACRLVGGDAVVGALSGAWLWGVSPADPTPIVIVTTRRWDLDPGEGIVVRRFKQVPRSWLTELRGVPVARPELVALHLFATLHEQRAERLVDRFAADRLLSGRSIAAFLAQWGERGRDGTAGLRRYLDERGETFVPSASGLESRMAWLLRRHGLAARRQVDLGDDAWCGRVDFLIEATTVVVEVQSDRHHTALTDVVADGERKAALEAAGFTVIEVWENDLWHAPEAAIERILAAVARTEREKVRHSAPSPDQNG